MDEDLTFRIITLGNSGVGKTSIIKRFVYEQYSQDALHTIGMMTAYKDIKLKNGKTIKLKIIDTAGQEKYHSLTKSYYKNADGVFFVFALDNLNSFENIEEWLKDFNENHDKENDKFNIPKYLIGNKCDVELDEIEVERKLIEKLQKDKNIEHYEAVSAKNNKNIDKIFDEISEMIFQIYLKNGTKEQKKIKVDKYKVKKEKKCSKCLYIGS